MLTEVSIIISSNNALYVCIAGDLNTDFSRATSWHTRSLNNFINMNVALINFQFKSRLQLLWASCNLQIHAI